MPQFSLKSVIIILLTAGIAIAAYAQNKDGKHEEHKAKNLTVLSKNISHDSLISLMKEYSVSLGVRCNFCHAKATDGKDHLDFASDDNKHKKIARYMIKMTAGINDKYFKEANSEQDRTALVIRCFTCHRGHEEPEAFVMPKDEDHH